MTVERVIFQLTGVKYDPYLKDQSFDDVVKFLTPKMEGIARSNQGSIPGYDYDDILQELSMEVWLKLPKVPQEIDKLDRRFRGYFETIFSRKIIDLDRSLRIQSKKIPGKYGDYRDNIQRAVFTDDVALLSEYPTIRYSRTETVIVQHEII